MKKHQYSVIAVCLLAIAIIGGGVYVTTALPDDPAPLLENAEQVPINDSETRHAPTEIAQLKNTITAMEGRLAKAEADINRLRKLFERVTQSPGPSFGQTEPQEKERLTATQIKTLNRQAQEQNTAKLTEYFQAEAVDASWSLQTIAMIQNGFNSESLNKAKLLGNDCRATLCRIEVLVDNQEQMLQFEAQFSLLVGAELPRTTTFTEEQENGSMIATIYLARKGYKLP